jgi:hypothetical protein
MQSSTMRSGENRSSTYRRHSSGVWTVGVSTSVRALDDDPST